MKFAEKLAAHITPEWNSQYIKYDEMKEFLYQYEQNAPIQDDEKLLQRYFARADETFFQFCDKELVKITIFFAEKLAEAKRKFEALKSELIDHTSTDRNRRQARSQRTQSVMEEIEEEEEEEDDKDKAAAAKETDLLRRRRSKRESSIAGESVAKPPSIASGAQTITQRLLEKNRERQAKKKLFRKAYDLKLAFSEFYLSLILLQNYQNLNFTGFKKILKKHDKIFKTSRGAEWYKANVEASTFFMDKTVDNLIAEVENLFTQYLENGDKERAMKRLRVPPFEEKQTPWTTFRLGLFIGMTCILFPVTIILLFMCYSKNHAFPFDWKVAIKLYRSTFLIILHIIFIGLNSYGWSRSGVNHVLIFEVDPRNHLTYQELLESGTFLGVFWFVSLISFLISAYYGVDLYIHPLGLVIFLTIYLINPLPKFYYSSRTWLMNVLWRVFCAPFYHVAFAHFWLADQLTSFDFLFNDVQFFTCWYIFENKWSPLKDIYSESPCKPRNNRDLSLSYNVIALLLMCMPSWIRFFQCLRRYRDTTNWFPHLVNAGKYSTTFLDIGTLSLKYHFSSMYSSDWENPFFYLWIIAKFFGTIYKLAWDYKMDWGFFDKNAGENRFLREVIVYSSKGYYYFAIIENFILRFIWLVRLYDIGLKGETYKEFVTTCLGFLEVFRRFVWNFFRLENEHLNNCGQFRAVRDISISPMQMTDLSSIEKMMDEEDGVINRQSTVIQQKTHQHNNQLTMTKRYPFIYNSSVLFLPTMNIQIQFDLNSI